MNDELTDSGRAWLKSALARHTSRRTRNPGQFKGRSMEGACADESAITRQAPVPAQSPDCDVPEYNHA